MAIKPWVFAAAATGVAALAGLGWFAARQAAYAEIAVGYAAKQTCSCLYVSGRTVASCMSDFPEEARTMLTIEPEGDRVEVSAVMGAIRSEAVHEDGLGCRLVR